MVSKIKFESERCKEYIETSISYFRRGCYAEHVEDGIPNHIDEGF